jgi:Type II secretion system (T2SS), protein E, N-terminal domain
MTSLPHPNPPLRLGAGLPPAQKPFLGEILVKRGRVSQERVDAALSEVQRTGRRLGDVLLERGWLYEDELAAALAEQTGVPYVDIQATSVHPETAEKFPVDFAEHFRAVPVRTMGSGATLVAVSDPADVDVEVLRIVLGTDVELAISELSAIRSAARRYCH